MKKYHGIFVFLCFAGLYLLSLHNNIGISHDSGTYLKNIITTPSWHPHHLIYEPLASVWYRFLQGMGFTGHPFVLVSSLNALLGGGIAALIFLILTRRCNLAAVPAFLTTAIACATYGMWLYATVTEVYHLSLFILLWAFYILSDGRMTTQKALLIGVLHGMAMLAHQMNVLFGLVVLFRLYKTPHFTKFFSLYLITGAAIVIAAYFYAGVIVYGLTDYQDFKEWFLGYALKDRYWKPVALGTFFMAIVGFARAWIGTHYVFSIDSVKQVVGQKFGQFDIERYSFLVHDMNAVTLGMVFFLTAVLALCLCVVLYKGLIHYKKYRLSLVDWLLLIWLLPNVAFFMIWEPFNPEFWIMPVMLLTILFFKVVQNRLLMTVTVSCLVFINALCLILPLQKQSHDLLYMRLLPVIQQAQPDDLAVARYGWLQDAYLYFYVKAPSIIIAEKAEAVENPAILEKQIRDVLDKGKTVYLLPDSVNFDKKIDFHHLEHLNALENVLRDYSVTKHSQGLADYYIAKHN